MEAWGWGGVSTVPAYTCHQVVSDTTQHNTTQHTGKGKGCRHRTKHQLIRFKMAVKQWPSIIKKSLSAQDFQTKETEGVQSTPVQNMPLWHINYFESKALAKIKKQQIEEKHFDLPSFS